MWLARGSGAQTARSPMYARDGSRTDMRHWGYMQRREVRKGDRIHNATRLKMKANKATQTVAGGWPGAVLQYGTHLRMNRHSVKRQRSSTHWQTAVPPDQQTNHNSHPLGRVSPTVKRRKRWLFSFWKSWLLQSLNYMRVSSLEEWRLRQPVRIYNQKAVSFARAFDIYFGLCLFLSLPIASYC